MEKTEFVGVDGCPSGWFSVGFDLQGGYELKVFPAFSELLGYYSEAKLVLVDIPIGLPEGPGGRECDSKARRKLGSPRSSSVFSAPTRQTVGQVARSPKENSEAAYRAAVENERRYANKGISRQTFAISHKTFEVDRLLKDPGRRKLPKIREVHPEVCFWALNDEKPMQHRKKVKKGRIERIDVLEGAEPRTKAIYDEALTRFRRRCVARDDVLDALVAAVTARCGHDRLKTIPKCPPTDCEGLPMEMVYFEG